MESPETWDLLTASLAICNLHDPASTWAFLAAHGLVREAPGDREAFSSLAEYEANHEITGPSAAARVARRLKGAGIAQPAGLTPDPWARIAKERKDSIRP